MINIFHIEFRCQRCARIFQFVFCFRRLFFCLSLAVFIDTIFMRVYQSFWMAQLSRKLEKALIFFPFLFFVGGRR